MTNIEALLSEAEQLASALAWGGVGHTARDPTRSERKASSLISRLVAALREQAGEVERQSADKARALARAILALPSEAAPAQSDEAGQ